MDAKDVLGLPKNSFPPLEKKSRPPKESQRKPDGISREVYALTSGLAPLMPAIEASQLKKKPLPLEKVTWQWLPFTSSTRKDNLHLYHWVRVVNGVPPTGDYFFANLLAVVQSVDIIKYTDEEYDKYLIDPVGIMSNCTILWNFFEWFAQAIMLHFFYATHTKFYSLYQVVIVGSRLTSIARVVLKYIFVYAQL
uniref:SWR1-complex protein 4 n=1 Tax=Cajanus cajan TaxID=3821 RepID=A0A151TFA4_CAJCA|nr:SWR1-complex protein 4 [Cajanus cajan]